MEIVWDKRHGKILNDLIIDLNNNNIRYFVLRNYYELPDNNTAKDVDIIFEPGNLKNVRKIMIDVFKKNSIEYYKEEIFGRIHSFWGNIITNQQLAIHIDLIEGYQAKGYEIYSFDELFNQTKKYKNFYVLNEFFSGIMLFIYKQFGYKKPKLKDEYKVEICETYKKYEKEFFQEIEKLTEKKFAKMICEFIKNEKFDEILKNSKILDKYLKRYAKRRRFFYTLKNQMSYNFQRLNHVFLGYKKFNYNFAVIAPDGTGKTTFLENIIEKLLFYRVCRLSDNHISIYHFRPNIFPNLGEIGEKAKIMKQDTDFTNPHRRKPAGKISSLCRIMYYSMDYILGWNIVITRDSMRNKWSIFDRYSYDLMVDPHRSRIDLPDWIRRFFVWITPKPNITFCLYADENIIYARKKELELNEIKRQLEEYKKISEKDKNVVLIDASNSPEKIANQAIKYLFEKYMNKI